MSSRTDEFTLLLCILLFQTTSQLQICGEMLEYPRRGHQSSSNRKRRVDCMAFCDKTSEQLNRSNILSLTPAVVLMVLF
jgi:hypothetical protein